MHLYSVLIPNHSSFALFSLKNKKVTLSSTASSKANMTSYKFNKMSSIKFTEKLGEKPERIPQISVAPPAASNKVTRPINQQKTSDKEREEVRKRIAAKMREKVTPSALKYGTPKRKPACTETPKSKVKFQEELNILHPHKLEPHEMSPMDTYEISDNDGSSSSSSDDSDLSDDGKPQKKVRKVLFLLFVDANVVLFYRNHLGHRAKT